MNALEKSRREYLIPVEWIAFGIIKIEATSLEEACEIAKTQPFPATADDGEDLLIRYRVMHDNLVASEEMAEGMAGYPPGFPLSVADAVWLQEQMMDW